MRLTIRDRYITKEILKVFFSFITCFYLLYMIFDYSMHIGYFVKNADISWNLIAKYYGLQFVKRLDLLLPLSMTIATLKVLFSLNTYNELMAFRVSGVRLNSIVRPIFYFSLCLTAISLLNFEFLYPKALKDISDFEKTYVSKSKSTKNNGKIRTVILSDLSKIIYQPTDNPHVLFDAFWVRSNDDIWYSRHLDQSTEHPTGKFVEHFSRDLNGVMTKLGSYRHKIFSDMPLESQIAPTMITPHEERSLSSLALDLWDKRWTYSQGVAKLQTHLFFKFIVSWLSPLVVLAIVPLASRFSRNHRVFLTFTLTIFGFIAFFIILGAGVILGENSLANPFIATFSLPLLLYAIFGWQYYKVA